MPVDTPDFPIGTPEDSMTLEPGQDLVVVNTAGSEVIRLDASSGTIRLRNGEQETIILLQGQSGNLRVGGTGADGDLLLYPGSAPNQDTDNATIHLNADGRSIRVGQPDQPGIVRVRGSSEQVDITGSNGTLTASGRVEVRTSSGGLRAQLDENGNATIGGSGARGRLEIRDAGSDSTVVLNGELGHARLGGSGTDARFELRQADGTVTIVLNGETANLGLGAVNGGNAGALFLKDGSGDDSVVVNGASAEARLGRDGNAGRLTLQNESGSDTIVLNGASGKAALGRFGVAGKLFLTDDGGQNSIHLSGATGNLNLTGDVRFTNSVADCAEEFDHALPGSARAGSVLIIGEDGRLSETDIPYDTRVAGVVSGAGHLRPGIILGADAEAPPERRCLLAVVGRVLVRADAGQGSIAIGDLLTTSLTPGHAMRVADRSQAAGAVIGKALGRLDSGQGLVEMLVSLQ